MIPDSVLERAVSVYLLGSYGLQTTEPPLGRDGTRPHPYLMADVGRPTSPIISVTVTN
jgi:hypothetical protein